MNEQLQQALLQLIEKSLLAVEKGAEFLGDEIPDVINQLLLWYSIKSFLFFLTGVGIGYVTVRYCKRFHAGYTQELKDRSTPHTDSDWFAAWMFTGVIGGFLTAYCIFINLDWLQILVAPKIWLIEYAADLVKGSKG